MPVDFNLGSITPHPEYITLEDAKTDLKRIDEQLELAKDHPDALLCEWLIIERDACLGFIERYNGHANGVDATHPLVIKLMSTIEKEDINFLWDKRIPRGKITDFSGDPGVGKSTAACMIAAMISRGLALPFDKEPEAPLKTLIISAEDTPADVLRPRLERMNADLDMIGIPDPEKNLTPSEIALHIAELFEAFSPALCILDPIIAYTQDRNTNKASEVRNFLGPLATLANKHQTAIITIRHLNKTPGSSALYRGQGSIDFAAICRSAFVFAKDSENSQRCFMSHSKSSLSKLQPTIEYFIDDDGTFRWGIETSETADEVLTVKGHKPAERQQAIEFLQKLLENGSMPSNELKDHAAKAGIAWRTVWRAKDELKIKASKERETGAWFWRLPLKIE